MCSEGSGGGGGGGDVSDPGFGTGMYGARGDVNDPGWGTGMYGDRFGDLGVVGFGGGFDGGSGGPSRPPQARPQAAAAAPAAAPIDPSALKFAHPNFDVPATVTRPEVQRKPLLAGGQTPLGINPGNWDALLAKIYGGQNGR